MSNSIFSAFEKSAGVKAYFPKRPSYQFICQFALSPKVLDIPFSSRVITAFDGNAGTTLTVPQILAIVIFSE